MKTNRRLIALALAGTLSLSLLAGCSSTAAGSDVPYLFVKSSVALNLS